MSSLEKRNDSNCLPALRTCTDCDAYRTRTLICSGVGPIPCDLAFIGEAPGAEEDLVGVPFIGKAGQLFDQLLERVGLKRSTVMVSNAIRCLTGRDSKGEIAKPSKEQLKACQKYLIAELELAKPKVLVALGASAFKALTGSGKAITKARGVPVEVKMGESSYTVVPTLHPSFALRRGGIETGEAVQIMGDIRHAVTLLNPVQEMGTYRIVKTIEEFRDFLRMALEWKAFAFDIETNGLDLFRSQILGIAFSGGEKEGWYVPLKVWDDMLLGLVDFWRTGDFEEVFESLRLLLTGDARKTAQNGKFDVARLKTLLEIEVTNWTFDTMLAAHLLDENRRNYGLKDMAAQRYPDLVGYGTEIRKLLGSDEGADAGEEFSKLPVDVIGQYSARDADATFRLSQELVKELQERDLLDFFRRFTMPVAQCLTDMEITGIAVDLDYTRKMTKRLSADQTRLLGEIRELAGLPGLNVNSPKQMIEVFNSRNLPVLKNTDKGAISVDAEVLGRYADEYHDPVAKAVLQYREITKLLTTYLIPLPSMIAPDGRVHTNFHQHRTVSGRLASSDPNLQNVPVRTELSNQIRGCFVAREGQSLICADYSQAELRMLAYVSQDSILLDACLRDVDLHLAAARMIYGKEDITPEERQTAKTVNFSILFGASAKKVAQTAGISVDMADAIVRKWFAGFPGVAMWIESVYGFVNEHGYIVSPFGRIRHLPDLLGFRKPKHRSNEDMRRTEEAKRQAINSIIQGGASDFCCFNMVKLADILRTVGSKARVILQVHDAVYVECPDEELEVIVPQMKTILVQSVAPVDVPMGVDIHVCKRWSDAT